MPKSASLGLLSVVVDPVTWMSLPSFAASTRSAATDITMPAPSSRDRAVVTALPSFQNRPTTPATSNNSPNRTPTTEFLIRVNQDVDVVSVMEEF